ncbi:hypothetical protein [Ostreiculturibacter nitratireducens]|uniref:hypothetical protein n=1 Tax=Ostreiculturibacter nitratireducens TaxID=3075226 RepID=UPI0031B63101
MIRGLTLTLAGFLGTLVLARVLRLALWLALRPGGWAVLATGALLAATAMR